jgi:hypothetical protein
LGVVAGAGVVFLLVRYMDRLMDLIDFFKKKGFLKLEICCPDHVKISEAAAEDSEAFQAFQADRSVQPGPDGEPLPNLPTEE